MKQILEIALLFGRGIAHIVSVRVGRGPSVITSSVHMVAVLPEVVCVSPVSKGCVVY